jgi:CxC6 like cysteine cluster associated with KDZ transposases
MNFYNINLLLSVKIQAAVCDGNTIGHPCCTVHDCKLPLDNHRLQFCSHHQDHCNICAVEGCGLACSPGSNTCHITEHQQLEDAYYKPAKALFQLHARLKKAGLSIPPDSMAARQRRGGRFLLGEVLDMDGGMC